MKILKSFFRRFKEESIAIPLMMLIVELLRRQFMQYFPEIGTFIPEAELLIYIVKLWQMLWITSGVWLVIRIFAPEIYFDLNDTLNFYSSKFSSVEESRRSYFSLTVFIAILIAFVLLFNGANGATKEQALRQRLCDTLNLQLYVREATGHNDGEEVERYLNSVGAKKGMSWCAAYVAYNYGTYKIANPNSGWAAAYANSKHKVKKSEARAGDVFTLYYKSLKRVGHVGFITGTTHGYFITNEGNTGGRGVREGDGVYTYLRKICTIYQVNNYITDKNERINNSIYSVRYFSGKLQNATSYAKRTYRENTQHKRLGIYECEHNTARYHCKNNGGQFKATNYHTAGRNIFATDSGNEQYAIVGRTKGQFAKSGVLLQGFGGKGKIAGTERAGVPRTNAIFERAFKNKGAKYASKGLYTEVCQVVNGFGYFGNISINDNNTHIYAKSIGIAGWKSILARATYVCGLNIGEC